MIDLLVWRAGGVVAVGWVITFGVIRYHERMCDEYDAVIGRMGAVHEAREALLPTDLDRHYARELNLGHRSDQYRALAAWRARPRYQHLMPPPRPTIV